jgi:hypothetical protein
LEDLQCRTLMSLQMIIWPSERSPITDKVRTNLKRLILVMTGFRHGRLPRMSQRVWQPVNKWFQPVVGLLYFAPH